MKQPDFDYTKPNNLLFHIDNFFIMIFAAVATTRKATTNAVYGNHYDLKIIKKVIYVYIILFPKMICNRNLPLMVHQQNQLHREILQ